MLFKKLPIMRMSVLLLASSCTVYAPMQPHLPVVQARGEGEVTVQTQGTIRPELTVAYSPVSHIVVMGGGVWRPALTLNKDGKSDNFRIQQGELSFGAYQRFGQHWTGMLTLGLGAAHTTCDVNGGLFSFNSYYEASYSTHFGQVGLYRQTTNLVLGMGYRLTQVAFQELSATDSGTGTPTHYVLPLDGQLRHEPFGFVQLPVGGPQGRWQLRASAAYSFCVPGRPGYPNGLSETQFRVQYNRGASLLLGAGVGYVVGNARGR